MHEEKEQLDKWADMWEKARDGGVFEEAPQPPTPPSQTADNSFFGLVQTHPTDEIQDVDSKYWNQIYDMSSDSGEAPDPLVAAERAVAGTGDPEVLQESGASSVDSGQNLMTKSSVGPDQDMTPAALGLTFTPEEVEDLSELKKKLHELQDQMNTVDGKGGRSKRFEKQLESMKVKIDELSNTFATIDNASKVGCRPGANTGD